MNGMEAEMVHQSRDVIRPDFHVVSLKRSLGFPVTAHIKIDAAKGL